MSNKPKQNLYTPKNFIECKVSQVTSVCIIHPFKSFNFLSINSRQYVESACKFHIDYSFNGRISNLAKKFSPTEQFPQHILPLLPLYNAQWWGYESLTAIVLVIAGTKASGFWAFISFSDSVLVTIIIVTNIACSKPSSSVFQCSCVKGGGFG